MNNNSLVLLESLSIPEKLSYFNQNDKNDYEVLAKRFREKKIRHIVTVARGSSDCAALFASYMFAKYLGVSRNQVREAINKHDTQRREAAFGFPLLLPALILSHGTKGAKSLDQDVKRRCRLFMNGQLSPLIRERDE